MAACVIACSVFFHQYKTPVTEAYTYFVDNIYKRYLKLEKYSSNFYKKK